MPEATAPYPDPSYPQASMWRRHAYTIARFTLLESLRTQLAWMVACTLLAVVIGALLLEQVAITESARIRSVFLAAACRLSMTVLLCQYVVASVVREFNDQAIALVLSLSVHRSALYAGKLAGFCSIALGIVVLTGAILAVGGETQRLPAWCALLFAELSLMAGVALFCAFGTRHALSATLLCAGFYVIARSMAALERLTDAQLAFEDSAFDRVAHLAVQILSRILPDLSAFARSEWLADATPPTHAVIVALVQSALYLVFTAAAGIHDLKRRSF